MIPDGHSCSFRRGMNWWTYTYLEDRLTTLTRYITLSESNEKTWSEELASLLILSGSATDTFFRNMKECPYLAKQQSCLDMEERVRERKESGGYGFWSIEEYRDAFDEIYELSENKIDAPFGLDKLLNIQPFNAFSKNNVPEWWSAYNKLKHNYYKKIEESAILKNVVNCIGGLLILNALHICSKEYLTLHGVIKAQGLPLNPLFVASKLSKSFVGHLNNLSSYDLGIQTRQFVFFLRAGEQ